MHASPTHVHSPSQKTEEDVVRVKQDYHLHLQASQIKNQEDRNDIKKQGGEGVSLAYARDGVEANAVLL